MKTNLILTFLLTAVLVNAQNTTKHQITSSWSEPNEKDEYHDFITIPENVSPAYVKVSLTQNNKDLKPAMVIARDLNKSGAIISGSSARTNNQFNRTAYFSVHPGMTYSVKVYPFLNAKTKDYPVPYTLAWEFIERKDIYEPNDTKDEAKQIGLNEQVEAYAIVGHIKQYYIGSSDENTYDWYKIVLEDNQKVKVELQDIPTDLDLNLRLFNTSGRQVGVESVIRNSSKVITTRSALSKGTYYLEVHPRMKGVRKSENDTKPIPDHFDRPYKLMVTDPDATNVVAGNGNNTSNQNTNQNAPDSSEQNGYTLKDLQGIWVRKASNLTSFNGLEIDLEGNQGTLRNAANSGFKVGDIKWTKIKKSGEATFDYMELATNGTYYASSIKFISKDVLELRVGSSGSGNAQTWERLGSNQIPVETGEEGNPVTISSQNLPCHISAATKLVNTAREVDYYANCVIDVTAPLIIEAGVVIEFAENAGLGVYEDGTLKMVGTSSEKIILQGKQKREGYWRGIHTQNSAEIEYAEIRHTGSSYVYCCNEIAGIFAKKGSLSVKNTKFGSNVGCAIFIGDEVKQFDNSENEIPINGICYSDPKPIPKIIDTATVLVNTLKHVDYYVPKDQLTEVYASLTIEPGVIIEFYEESALRILKGLDGSSNLIAEGTQDERIAFQGDRWKGIFTETNTSLKYVDVSYGGFSNFPYYSQKASILAAEGKLTLQNCIFYGQTECAVYVDWGVDFSEHASAYLFNANLKACINDQILPREIKTPTVLKNTDRAIDYIVPVNQVTRITAELTIEPGVVIEFGEDAGFGIYDAGRIIAEGTAAERISFKGLEQKSGYWRGIHIESAGNAMEYIDISSAGSKFVFCCNEEAAIFIKSGVLDISSSIIHDNAGCGIFVGKGATLAEGGNAFLGNAEGHICN